MTNNNWAKKLASEFKARDNISEPAWQTAACTSPVWDEEEQQYVGPFLASAYDGQIVLDESMCAGGVSQFHEGMTVYFTGTPFNGNQVYILGSGSGGGGGQTYAAGYGLELTSNVFSVDDTVIATQADLMNKQDALTAGTGITITNNTVARTTTFMGTSYTQASITDMNELTATRFSKIYANLKSIANAPADVYNGTAYYSLIVPPSYSSNRIAQILIYTPGTAYDIKIWIRTRYASAGWKEWQTIKFDTGGNDRHGYVAATTDLNTITEAGSYIIERGASGTHRPAVDTPAGTLNVEISSGVIYQHLLTVTSPATLYTRTRTDGTWSNWTSPNAPDWNNEIPLYELLEEEDER